MGNSQYRRQHYITYHGYKYSLAGFTRQSGDYYLFPPPEISGGQCSERAKKVSATFLGHLVRDRTWVTLPQRLHFVIRSPVLRNWTKFDVFVPLFC